MNPLSVANACRDLGLRVGAIRFGDVEVRESPAELRDQIDEAVGEVCRQVSSASEIRALPDVASFREILKSVGVDPRKHSPTVEILSRMAIKRRTLPAINSLVDAYNLISLRTRFSMGAHDVDQVGLPLELTVLDEPRCFVPLGTTEAIEVPAGEFAYVDARQRVVCRLDLQQADFSKITPATTNALLIIEGTTVHTSDQFDKCLELSQAIIERYCGGRVKQVVQP